MTLEKNKLKELREQADLSQEKLAIKVEVTRQTIISIETGKYVPSLELALKFAKLFRVFPRQRNWCISCKKEADPNYCTDDDYTRIC